MDTEGLKSDDFQFGIFCCISAIYDYRKLFQSKFSVTEHQIGKLKFFHTFPLLIIGRLTIGIFHQWSVKEMFLQKGIFLGKSKNIALSLT